MRKLTSKFILSGALVLGVSFVFTGCKPNTGTVSGTASASGNAFATVNGKSIYEEEVEKIIKSQLRGEESKLSPIELAQARLSALDSLIKQEVMFQRAEKEKTVPTDEEVQQELNRRKTEARVSVDEFNKRLSESGLDENGLKNIVKRELAINKLIEKVTNKVTPPTDKEIEEVFNSNKAQFVKPRGAQFAAIVVDPQNNGEGDTTKDPQSAQLKVNEIIKQLQQGGDFATVARDKSEDPQSGMRGGDWQFLTEEQMKQISPQFAEYVMTKMQVGSLFPQVVPIEGRYLILKLQQKQEKSEDLTLENQQVKTQITDYLTNSRKQIVSDSFAQMAISEAKVENFLAKQIIENPNNLSGARPAGASATPTPAETVNTNANTAAGNANTAANAGNANANKAR